ICGGGALGTSNGRKESSGVIDSGRPGPEAARSAQRWRGTRWPRPMLLYESSHSNKLSDRHESAEVVYDDDDFTAVEQFELTTIAQHSEVFGAVVRLRLQLFPMQIQRPVQHQRERAEDSRAPHRGSIASQTLAQAKVLFAI